MRPVKEKRLEIKSYNDEVLKDVQAYFAKYPKLPEVSYEVSQIEKELREELEYLKLILKK